MEFEECELFGLLLCAHYGKDWKCNESLPVPYFYTRENFARCIEGMF